MRRVLLTVAAMLIPVAGLTLGISGTAGAGTGKLTCTTLSGNISGNITVSGCTGGVTGGGSQPLPALALGTGGTITWLSGSSTTISAPALTPLTPKKCPGYVKNAATNPTAESFTATVTADSGDGMLLPGTTVGEVCIGTDGTISALKALKVEWTTSSLTCSALSGSATGNIAVSGCVGGDTGGGSHPLSALALAKGGTISWLSGSSTTISAPVLVPTSNKKCPGYIKNAATNPTAEKFTATVTSDSGDGIKLPGSAKGAVCIAADGTITALKPLAAK